MKTLIYLLAIVGLFAMPACKKNNYETVTVITDCTGTYLRINSKDYFVCNPQKISSQKNNSEIKVEYTKCTECDDGEIHCALSRSFEGWLVIDKIK